MNYKSFKTLTASFQLKNPAFVDKYEID